MTVFGKLIRGASSLLGAGLKGIIGMPLGSNNIMASYTQPMQLQSTGSMPLSKATGTTNKTPWYKSAWNFVKANWLWFVIPIGVIVLFMVVRAIFFKGKRKRATYRRGTTATKRRMAKVRAARTRKMYVPRSRGKKRKAA